MNNVKLEFEEHGGKPGVKIQTDRSRPNSALTYIRKLLADGFRGNRNYYRDSDKRLILKVWEKEGLILNKDQRSKFMHDVTFPDTITRARRSLRAEFPESPEVEKKRFHLFLEHKDRFSRKPSLRRLIARKA